MHTDEIGAVGVNDGDRLALNADDILAILVRDADLLRARMSCEWDVIELDIVLRNDGVARLTVRVREKKYGADPAEEEQRADEYEVVLLHWSSLP